MTTLQKYLVLSFGYGDLVGIEGAGGTKRIISQIKEFNLYAVLETCSKISLALLNRGVANPLGQAELLGGIFPDKKQRIRFYERARSKADGSPWAIFNNQSVLTLAKIALTNCPIEGGKSVDTSNIEQLGYWLLILNDECFAEETTGAILLPSREHERERLMKSLARYQFLHNTERLGYKMGRFRWIVDYFKKENPHGIDIASLFEESTGGISLDDYMTVCASLLVKWVNISTKEKIDLTNDWVTCPDVYFKDTKLDPSSIEKVLSLISMLPQEFPDLYKISIEQILGGKEQFHYNFMPSVWRPLVWYQDKKCFICPSVEYLYDKVTDGIYRTIETYLRTENRTKERDTFAIAWGDVFEQYIKSSLSASFGNSFHHNPRDKKSNKEMIDGVIDSESFVFIIETKNLHWSYKTMVSGDIDDTDSPIKQLFTNKGMAQISTCIRNVKNDTWTLPVETKNKQFIPLLIVSEHMPGDTYNRRLYETFAAQAKTKLNDNDVLPFIILNAEEVEILEAIASERGAGEVIQILAEYTHLFLQRNDLGFVPNAIGFKNYLYENGYEKTHVPTNNKRLLKYFDDVMDDVCIKAFGRKIEKRRNET
ncbi:MAG TPA: hypothetical protein PLS49_07100 [Candidatus Woesebacteria bacterium]|nr:hypothetical protein [Candidatus Woesebacteria bacterium]